MNIADKIKKARQAANLTQQDVSDKLNISRKTLSGWENNCSNPDLEMIKALAEVFGKDLNYFLEIGEKDHESKTFLWVYAINIVLFAILIISNFFN